MRGWFRRKPKRLTLEQVHLRHIIEMFEALPKPEVSIPSTVEPRTGYWCTTQHFGPNSNMKSAGVHYHPGTMPAGSEPQAPKK